jgi:NAD(P)-dependent dehydrogenase (short-subunit alcohol dehydrogenase family)
MNARQLCRVSKASSIVVARLMTLHTPLTSVRNRFALSRDPRCLATTSSMDIAGRTAVVTGAGIGTGRAIALALSSEGADVVVSDVDERGGNETAAMCHGRARFLRADLTVENDVRHLIEACEPTILVNNAGGGGHIPPHFPEASPDQWGATLDLNLRAPMLATQLALAPMRRAGAGAIVNVASSAGLGSEPYQSPEYGAAKAGLIRFTSAVGAIDGVRVNCIVPDWVATERVTAKELASTPPPIPLATVTAAVIRLIRDDTLAGRALVLWRGEPPRLD